MRSFSEAGICSRIGTLAQTRLHIGGKYTDADCASFYVAYGSSDAYAHASRGQNQMI